MLSPEPNCYQLLVSAVIPRPVDLPHTAFLFVSLEVPGMLVTGDGRLEGESQETFQRGEVSASRFLIINSKGRQKLTNISLRIEWL